MNESSEQALTDAIRDALTQDGRLGRLRAEIRAAVLSVLNKNPSERTPVQLPPETKLVNELVREYLVWNGYLYTEQILMTESGQQGEKLPRDDLAAKLSVMDDERTSKIPLIYYVVAAFQNQDNQS